MRIADDGVDGMSAEEIHKQSHLPLAKVHAALVDDYDHQVEFDAEVEQRRRYADEMRRQNPNPLTREDLVERVKFTTGCAALHPWSGDKNEIHALYAGREIFRPFGTGETTIFYPWLTPWARVYRRYAAIRWV